MIEQVLNNWLCWAIILVALVCYHQLWLDYFTRSSSNKKLDNDVDQQVEESLKRDFSGILIGVLPLMGLLGTIIGLLDCFAGIASEGASGDLVSGGIASALITTQLGLVCAIPGWLLQAFVRSRSSKQQRQQQVVMS